MRISNKTRFIGLILSIALLSACATNKSKKFGPYYLEEGMSEADIYQFPKKYRLASFKLTMDGSREKENYPTEEELNRIFINQLNIELRKQNKLSQTGGMDVSIVMKYERIFVGGAFHDSSAYGSNKCAYTSTLSVDGKEVAFLNDEPMTRTTVSDDYKSVFKNFAKIATQLTSSGDREDEEKDIQTCAQRIIERLPKWKTHI